jgi:hypothetical protein
MLFQFGSLVNGITNTARKAVTLALSFALFPERNSLEFHHIFGGCIFFCGLIVRTVMKDNTEKNNNTEMNNKPNLQKFTDNEKILSQILPENNFSVSERDYFTTVECIGDSSENGENSSGRENDIEDGRRRMIENENKNGSKYYSDNKNKNNYTPLQTNGSAEYNGNRSKTVYDARYNPISENPKTTTLHNNIHYNGIDSIIVNTQSPPLSRKSPMNGTPHRTVNGQNNGFERTENSGIINGENKSHEKINKNDNDGNNYKNNRNTVSPVFLSSNGRNSTIKNSRSSNTTIV